MNEINLLEQIYDRFEKKGLHFTGAKLKRLLKSHSYQFAIYCCMVVVNL